MKPSKVLFLSLFILFNTRLVAQSKYQKIETFSKVWGFLKYHHPAVATGAIDWDSVFIAHINKARGAKNIAQFNEEISATISAAGLIKKATPANLPADVFIANHNINWLYTSKLLSKQNQEKLQFIYNNRNQGENRFIKSNNYSNYSGEKAYENMNWPTEEYRLLFLSRFWNAINYFDPYKYIIGDEWDNVLSRFIPQIINAKDTITYYKTLMKLAVSLNDGHSQLTFSHDEAPINDVVFGKYTVPLYADIIDGKVIVRKLANDSLNSLINIRPGDMIIGINNETIEEKINELKAYVSASNKNSRMHFLSWLLFDTHSLSEELRVKRGTKIFTLKISCILTSKRNWSDLTNYTDNKTGYKTIGNSIAYVYASQIWHGNLDTIKALIRSKKAVIFDVRNYPNNDDFYNIFHMFLPGPKMIDLSLQMMTDNPGYFKWLKSPMMGDINNSPYRGKVIIFVDERSQSQGEYSAMALQTIPSSITIGSQTAGADGAVSPIPMGGQLAISYSGYGIFYPDKTPTQRRGVKIDIQVKKTIESVSKDQDVILNAALKYLKDRGID